MPSNIFPRRRGSRAPVVSDDTDRTLLEPSSWDEIETEHAFRSKPPVPFLCAPPPRSDRQARDPDIRPAPRGDVPPRVWAGGEVTGLRLGAYMVYEEIARGGMATVHLGRAASPEGGRIVAIKRLDSELARNPNAVAMFVEEGRTAARIRHPNVVSPIDLVFRVLEGEVFLVMEYVHGETLAELLEASVREARHPSSRIAVGIIVGALRGLQAAHEAKTVAGTPMGIVHRDVSPQNIMVGADGAARLLDFGVAKVVSTEALSGDDRDQRYKPSYVAPEQAHGRRVDRRADIFSAGVVLWETLAGRRLFFGNDHHLARGSLDRDIPPPSRFNSVVPATLDAVVLGALEYDPALRFASARNFSRALSTAVEPASEPEIAAWVQQVSGARLGRRAERVARIVAGEPSSSSPGPKALPVAARPARWWARTRTWKALAPAGLMVALTCVGLWSSSGAALPRIPSAPSSAPSSRSTESQSSEVSTSTPAPPAVIAAVPEEKEAADAEPEAPAPHVASDRDRHPPGKGRPDAVAEIVSLNHRALRAYRRGDLGSALKLLETALAAGAGSRLNRHRSLAVTHAELAAVLVVGFNQSQLGIEHFRRAFRLDSRVTLARSLRTRETVAAFREAAGAAPVQPEG